MLLGVMVINLRCEIMLNKQGWYDRVCFILFILSQLSVFDFDGIMLIMLLNLDLCLECMYMTSKRKGLG